MMSTRASPSSGRSPDRSSIRSRNAKRRPSTIDTPADRFVILSGCSGGGKSTLLAELSARGFAVVEEPGRRIVEAETAKGGTALPWIDLEAFVRRALALALADYDAARANPGLTFFDRGIVDAAVALEHLTGEPVAPRHCHDRRYAARVFLSPPWPEIYRTDAARRHSLGEAIEEYNRLVRHYTALGYEITLLPKIPVAERADLILSSLSPFSAF